MSKKCYLDANLLVYFSNKGMDNYHERTAKILSSLVQEKYILYISPLCLDEFLFTIIKIMKVNKKTIQWKVIKVSLDNILKIPNLEIINPPTSAENQKKIIAYMKNHKLAPRDAYHLLTMESNDIKHIATFDSDFSKIKSVTVIN